MKTTATQQLQTATQQPKANKQAGTQQILQRYKQQTSQLQAAEEEELLQGKFETAQRMELDEEEPVQGKFDTTQLMELDEEEPLQGKFATTQLAAEEQALAAKPNNTGLPDNLKSGIENMSGYSMDDVKVHYNSDKPAQLQAHAYAQGTNIHIAPGQEKHLPHEAWHVVQQKQGRVQPTKQLKGKTNINDDAGLEKEADVMGAQAMQLKAIHSQTVQRNKDEEGLTEVSIEDLPEDQARKHLSDSFKKGEKLQNPLVDKSGTVVQRKPTKEDFDGGELFTVLKSDLDKGTVTSKETRDYVNNPATYKPKSILFDYSSASSTVTATSNVLLNRIAHAADNPKAPRSYKSGKYWDAGHKLGKQNGGLGDDEAWVFPQNPALNQGNSRNEDVPEETHPIWRGYEDKFYNGVNSDGGGVWWIQLR